MGTKRFAAVSMLSLLTAAFAAQAETLDFTPLVYPDILEDQTIVVSGGGVNFTMTPVNNLVGTPRWAYNNKIHFGGGGGSLLEFDFTPDTDVLLDSYTIGGVFLLGNPDFQIAQDVTVLSASNDANVEGTFAFDGGSIPLTAGTTYTFATNTSGAAIQSAFTSWDFTVVPEPGTLCLLGLGLLALRRR